MGTAAPGDSAAPLPYVPPPRRGGALALGIVIGIVLGAAIGTAIIAPLLTDRCSCAAVLVLDVGFEAYAPGTSPPTYVFNVTGVDNGAPTYGDVDFLFWNSTGQGVAPSFNWTLVLAGPSGSTTSHYDPDNASWPGIGARAIGAGQSWTFDVPWPSLTGGALGLQGTNAQFSGECVSGIA